MANISGRNREVNEVVQYLRAAEVGRLLLGELNGPMDWIDIQDFIMKPRRELKAIRSNVQRQLRDEIGRFCSRNFENVKAADLARLYEPLHQRGSSWRLPLVEFVYNAWTSNKICATGRSSPFNRRALALGIANGVPRNALDQGPGPDQHHCQHRTVWQSRDVVIVRLMNLWYKSSSSSCAM